MSPKLRWFLVTFAIAYPIDQITKRLVMGSFYYGESLTLIEGFFDITYVRNPGGAFSIFAHAPDSLRIFFFIGMACVAIALLLVFYYRLEPEAALSAAALGTILGGALGNLTDRIDHGEVVDFLDFHVAGYTWPTFNFADSFIVVGVGFLILEIFLQPQEHSESVPPVPDEPAAAAGSEGRSA